MPIFDQFDIATNSNYSGSYTDNIVRIFSGSGLESKKFIGSKSDPITGSMINFETSYTDYVSYVYGRVAGKNHQFISLLDGNEIYYDSLVPSPVDYHIANSGTLISNEYTFTGSNILNRPNFAINSSFSLFLNLNSPTSSIINTGSVNYLVRDGQWVSSFPFEIKYKNLTKLKNQTYYLPKTYISNIGYGYSSEPSNSYLFNKLSPAITSSIFNGKIVLDEFVSLDLSRSYAKQAAITYSGEEKKLETVRIPYGITGDELIIPYMTPNLKESYKLYFGSWRKRIVFRINESGVTTNIEQRRLAPEGLDKPGMASLVDSISGIGDETIILSYITPSGWKYGLYSAEPSPTKIIFRRNRFGQFRDILEQRQFTKFSSGKKNSITSSPVVITFLSGTSTYVTYSNDSTLNLRDSGIYRREYASGRPFDDT